GEAHVLARHGATAMIDVSDGLALDLSRMCDASGVGARLNLEDVPVHPAAAEGGALGGGEDYALLAKMPSGGRGAPRAGGGHSGPRAPIPSAAAAAEAAAELRELFGVPLTTIGTIVVSGLEALDAARPGRARHASGA